MGGVRHRCEQGAQKRPWPPGEKDRDTATGACVVSVYMAVSVNLCVHCAGRVCAHAHAYLVTLFCWETTAALDSHLPALLVCFLSLFPFPLDAFCPLRILHFSWTSPYSSLWTPAPRLLHICKDPCSSTWSSFTSGFFLLPLNTISGPLIFPKIAHRG